MSSLQQVVKKATNALDNYEYNDARTAIENFFWKDFCDNYLELIKNRVYDPNNSDPHGKESAITTLQIVFADILRLLSPFLPHTTDEINEMIYGTCYSLSKKGNWSQINDHYYDENFHNLGNAAKIYLELIHKYKSLNELALNYRVKTTHYTGVKLTDDILSDLKNASHSDDLIYSDTIVKDKKSIKSACEKYAILVGINN